MRSLSVLLIFLASACSTVRTTPGATLLSGLNTYQSQMTAAGNAPGQWPARQRAASALKLIMAAGFQRNQELQRLVDLDLRKREFQITLEQANVLPERKAEMTEELRQMELEVPKLKTAIKAQLSSQTVTEEKRLAAAATAATIGWLQLRIESFPASPVGTGASSPSTQFAQYLVGDWGQFAMVRAPDGQRYRCDVVPVEDEGAWMRCEAIMAP